MAERSEQNRKLRKSCSPHIPKGTSGDPGELSGCPKLAQWLSNKFLGSRDSAPIPRKLVDVGQHLPTSPKVGRFLSNLDQDRPNLTEFRSEIGEKGQGWPTIVQHRLNLVEPIDGLNLLVCAGFGPNLCSQSNLFQLCSSCSGSPDETFRNAW